MMVPLVEQNHVHFQRVKLGADDGAQVEVLDGLRGGETVALNLGAEVSDGPAALLILEEKTVQGQWLVGGLDREGLAAVGAIQ